MAYRKTKSAIKAVSMELAQKALNLNKQVVDSKVRGEDLLEFIETTGITSRSQIKAVLAAKLIENGEYRHKVEKALNDNRLSRLIAKAEDEASNIYWKASLLATRQGYILRQGTEYEQAFKRQVHWCIGAHKVSEEAAAKQFLGEQAQSAGSGSGTGGESSEGGVGFGDWNESYANKFSTPGRSYDLMGDVFLQAVNKFVYQIEEVASLQVALAEHWSKTSDISVDWTHVHEMTERANRGFEDLSKMAKEIEGYPEPSEERYHKAAESALKSASEGENALYKRNIISNLGDFSWFKLNRSADENDRLSFEVELGCKPNRRAPELPRKIREAMAAAPAVDETPAAPLTYEEALAAEAEKRALAREEAKKYNRGIDFKVMREKHAAALELEAAKRAREDQEWLDFESEVVVGIYKADPKAKTRKAAASRQKKANKAAEKEIKALNKAKIAEAKKAAKAEAELKAKEEAERRAKEEAERKAITAAGGLKAYKEAQAKARIAEAKAEVERKAKAEAERNEAARLTCMATQAENKAKRAAAVVKTEAEPKAEAKASKAAKAKARAAKARAARAKAKAEAEAVKKEFGDGAFRNYVDYESNHIMAEDFKSVYEVIMEALEECSTPILPDLNSKNNTKTAAEREAYVAAKRWTSAITKAKAEAKFWAKAEAEATDPKAEYKAKRAKEEAEKKAMQAADFKRLDAEYRKAVNVGGLTKEVQAYLKAKAAVEAKAEAETAPTFDWTKAYAEADERAAIYKAHEKERIEKEERFWAEVAAEYEKSSGKKWNENFRKNIFRDLFQ